MLAKRTSSASKRPASTLLSGISLGDTVRLTWPIDPAYGSGRGEFIGKAVELIDNWVKLRGETGNIFATVINKQFTVEKR
jgi:hypothetical protein